VEPELLSERSHVGSIVIARHVPFVERQLQSRRPAANQVPGDQTFGLEAAWRVLERFSVETGLNAGAGRGPHDRVQIDLSRRADQNEARGPLIERHRVPHPAERVDRGIDGFSGHPEIGIPVRSGLPSQQGVDTPAARQPSPNARSVKGCKNP